MTFESPFSRIESERYSRQLLLNDINADGQLAIMKTRVLIVGAGGLGSSCALYLAAAGIGNIGIVDYDMVELSNLHRQIIHRESTISLPKAESARHAIIALNSHCKVQAHNQQLSQDNAHHLISEYDIVVDASDNPPTRYLVNDVCVSLKRPLVSASAIRWEGQLTVYNFMNAPCYRCLFPTPPPISSVSNCEEGGVVGAVVGVLGSMQAMEVIKIALLLAFPPRADKIKVYAGSMLLYHGLNLTMRTVKLRARQSNCLACGDHSDISRVNYESWCQMPACEKTAPLKILLPDRRVSVHEYFSFIKGGKPHILLDVRPRNQFAISRLANSINIPIDELENQIAAVVESAGNTDVFIICRRGNKSQIGVEVLGKAGIHSRDIIGGLTLWSKEIDSRFPIY